MLSAARAVAKATETGSPLPELDQLADLTALERFVDKINIADSGCWEWTAGKAGRGYGIFYFKGKQGYAHRASWAMFNGRDVPDEHDIDHLCRNVACVNPEHLEAVSHAENVLRGERGWLLTGRCHAGLHDISDPANVYTYKNGSRRCRPCSSAASMRARGSKC